MTRWIVFAPRGAVGLVDFAQTRLTGLRQNPLMPGSEFRQKAAECRRQAQDAIRTAAQRAESQLQEQLWLKMAHDADENDDARRLRIALRAAQ